MISANSINQYSTTFVLLPANGAKGVRCKAIKAINGDAVIVDLRSTNLAGKNTELTESGPITLREGDMLFGNFYRIQLDPGSNAGLYCLNL